MRLAPLGRWMSAASAVAGAALIALSLGATPQLDRTLAAAVPPSSATTTPVVLQAAGHGDHDGDGHGPGDHRHDGRGL